MTPKPPSPTKTTELDRAKIALRNLIIEAEYCRTGHLPSVSELDKQQLWWLTHATEPHGWDVPSPKPSAEGTPFVDEVRRIVQETGCDEASAKARILREAAEGAVEITADWKVRPSAQGTERKDFSLDRDQRCGHDMSVPPYSIICDLRKGHEGQHSCTIQSFTVAPGEAVGRETREPTKSNVTTFSAATEKCATRIWDMYLKGSGLDVDMAFADLCREINDAMQSELSTLTALRELDKEAFEMLNTSETEGMRLVAELRATIERLEGAIREFLAHDGGEGCLDYDASKHFANRKLLRELADRRKGL